MRKDRDGENGKDRYAILLLRSTLMVKTGLEYKCHLCCM